MKIARFIRTRLPKFSFYPITKKKLFSSQIDASKVYSTLASKILNLNRSIKSKPSLDCNTVLTISLDIIDSLQNDRAFYLQQLYESALMSENRKMVENLQSRLLSSLENALGTEQLPVPADDFRYNEQKINQEMNKGFMDNVNKDTHMKAGLEFYFELQANINEMLEAKRIDNEEVGKREAKNLMDSLFLQIKGVDQYSAEDLRSQVLVEALEENVQNLISQYFEVAKGNYKCKIDDNFIRPAAGGDASELFAELL